MLTGATRVFVIAGDPIAQVKAPAGVTACMREAGFDGIVVPAHVAPAAFDGFMTGLRAMQNLDGVLATVPHKLAMRHHCASVTKRAELLGAVNVARRVAEGWFGDMTDGAGFIAAQRAAGIEHRGRRALLVGAGGAGSAIALALLEAGVSRLALHDADTARRDGLLATLQAAGGTVEPGTDDPEGFDLVCNATPSGMPGFAAAPVRLDRLAPTMAVGDVVTVPEVTPLIAAARALGCRASTGVDMFEAQAKVLADFLTAR